MGYERQGGYYDRSEQQDYGHDYGSGQDFTYSSAREYQAAGERGGREGRDEDRRPYGQREFGNQRYNQRERMNRGQSMYGGGDRGRDFDRGFDNRDSDYYEAGGGDGRGYRGSYGSGGHRFEDTGGGGWFGRDRDDDDRGRNRSHGGSRGDYGRGGRDRDDDRGFFARAGDEVRSWFGDDEAERRRQMDDRGDRRARGNWSGDWLHDHRDRDYHEWRQGQIAQLDRDYDEYRRENRARFENEFSSWRTNRQGQRSMLSQVQEHAEVVGSDGERVGTVDKVRGDRIILTKNDPEAGGRHHSIPCSWLQSAEGGKVTLNKSSVEAKTMWRDEERQGAMFGQDRDDDQGENRTESRDNQGRVLNRSFSGTY